MNYTDVSKKGEFGIPKTADSNSQKNANSTFAWYLGNTSANQKKSAKPINLSKIVWDGRGNCGGLTSKNPGSQTRAWYSGDFPNSLVTL